MRLSGPLLVACISLSGSLRGALKVLLHHPDGNVLSALGAALDGYDTDLCRHTDERHTGNDGVPNGQNTIRKTATVKNNENGSVWAKFPLAIRITRKDKDGNEKKISALQDIEVATKKDSPKLELLKKGTIVKVEGFFEPRVYTGKDEKEHSTISWKATAIEKIEKKEDTQEA